MKLSNLSKAAYEQAYGPVGRRRASEETLAFWQRVQKLSVAEYLIIEPDKGADLKKERNKHAHVVKKFTMQANFQCRFAINEHEKHIVCWKEPKVGK
jgi:hypothetical protein